jgi:hypothetical protein
MFPEFSHNRLLKGTGSLDIGFSLSRRRVGKPSLIFAAFLQCLNILRSRGISVDYRTAQPVHCKEKKRKIFKTF